VKLQSYFRSLGKKTAAATSAGAQVQRGPAAAGNLNAVLEAITDQRFHFRTIPSIAAETGMPEREVRSILEKHTDEVRRAPLEDGKGNALYTHRSRPRTVREILAETRAFLKGSR
jgi:hypothetical protein